MYNDIELKLKYFASSGEWHVYASNGAYRICNSLDELPEGIRQFMASDGIDTFKQFSSKDQKERLLRVLSAE